MNKQNIRLSALYDMLTLITGKKKETIKTYFRRNKIRVDNEKDFLRYIKLILKLKD